MRGQFQTQEDLGITEKVGVSMVGSRGRVEEKDYTRSAKELGYLGYLTIQWSLEL